MEASQNVQKFGYGILTKPTDVPGICITRVPVPVPVPALGCSFRHTHAPDKFCHGVRNLRKFRGTGVNVVHIPHRSPEFEQRNAPGMIYRPRELGAQNE